MFRRAIDPGTGEPYVAVDVRGRAVLLHPLTNKGTAFTLEERAALGIEGLLPPTVSTMAQQLARAYEGFSALHTSLERYIFLASLQDRNETLFHRLLLDHVDEMMPVVYTPTVGEACQRFSHIYRRGRGLFVAYEARDRIEAILRNAEMDDPAVIVVTDGERILGLGDQGAGGMGISIGKLVLYTLCAGISPYRTLPIALDVGTDNRERLADPLYLGSRHERVRGDAYQGFVDAFVAAVQRVFPRVVLQWEDFLKGNAMHQLARFRDTLCTFNDDIQGTAAVTVAGMLASLRITRTALRDQRVVIAGAGASAQGIAELLVAALVDDGLDPTDAVRRVWMVDTGGLVTADRPGLEGFKATFARPAGETSARSLLDTVRAVRPTALVGTSATPGLFDEAVVRAVSAATERPLVFPLSNPTSKAECTPEDALRWSEGRAIVATGSPFAPVTVDGRRRRIGQCNNAYVFPGVGLGVSTARARRVTDRMFLAAARALAGAVSESDLAEGALYPPLSRIREVSRIVAEATVRQAVAEGHADAQILDDLPSRLALAMWTPDYLPIRYVGR